MTRDEIVLAIQDIIQTIAPDEDLSNLDHAERLRDQIELDSMDFLDIVMELRKLYGVQIPEEDYKELASMDGCVNYLEPHLADKELHCASNA
ncbi:Acyl carrier protein [Planctomycetes bacterium Pla163]|uniref:Acyl carrier protein n=1 Tax=Rohdeia mirabilis TaxID=2528008 RepID=A0A518CYS5_9BACT|nr:Acyl carrier protein [Planctomycetes bacterium Pla163]